MGGNPLSLIYSTIYSVSTSSLCVLVRISVTTFLGITVNIHAVLVHSTPKSYYNIIYYNDELDWRVIEDVFFTRITK